MSAPSKRQENIPGEADGFVPIATHGRYRLMAAKDQAAHDELRRFVQTQFREHFRAEVPDDTPRLQGIFHPIRGLTAAFGIRTAADGFFSEHYLGKPLADALPAASHGGVDMSRVVEIAHFSVATPRVFGAVVPLIAQGLSNLGFEHVVCTATRCLVRYFARRYLTPVILSDARASALPEDFRSCWGSYYLADPAVAFGALSGVLGKRAC
ncbi:MAG: thermostable hemolysin [Pseudomonadales bacterium]|jgi:hypothetical protein